jgi:serine/threonine protein kinase
MREWQILLYAVNYNSLLSCLIYHGFCFFRLSGGELFDRLVAEDYDLKESDCIEYVRQICQGVQHMHGQNIIHLDLKVGSKTRYTPPHALIITHIHTSQLSL